MAQPGRAQRLGRWGRGFKSLRPDHFLFSPHGIAVSSDSHLYKKLFFSPYRLVIYTQLHALVARFVVYSTPVSYTHLDVYKRQQ